MSAFYNLALLLIFLVMLPKRLWECARHGKYRASLRMRFGYGLPLIKPGKPVLWMHAVSVGEVKALSAIFYAMKERYQIVISTTTQTGLNAAKAGLHGAAGYFLLPLDFSWIIKKVMKQIHPSGMIFCESDFWYHLLKCAKEQGAFLVLINGKISTRSFRRFSMFSHFAKRLFSLFDCLCVQNEMYKERFSHFVPIERLHVTGNLKLEARLERLSAAGKEQLRDKLGLQPLSEVIVIGSTHDPEERELLSALTPLLHERPLLKILLVPRHPERFDSVAQLLKEMHLPYSRFSCDEVCNEKLILVDAMGVLVQCYELATLAIVAGSYTERVGGHNIVEPVLYGVPVFFGPFMHSQEELKELVLSFGAGEPLLSDALYRKILTFLDSPQELKPYRTACETLKASIEGSVRRTLEVIHNAESRHSSQE